MPNPRSQALLLFSVQLRPGSATACSLLLRLLIASSEVLRFRPQPGAYARFVAPGPLMMSVALYGVALAPLQFLSLVSLRWVSLWEMPAVPLGQ